MKKVILSLKINDPLVTKAGNVPLSPRSEKVVEQAALSDLKSEQNATHSVQCFLRKHSSEAQGGGKEAGTTWGNERSGEFC